MIHVSKKKFLERLDVLPPAVREMAFSPDTGGIISAIGKAYHLDEQRIGALIATTGAIFFGFLHRADLMKEIFEEARVDAKIAQSIADEIEQKVFARIRDDLDRIFQPVSAEEEVEEEIQSRPSSIEKSFFAQPSQFQPAETRSEKPISAPKGEGPLVLHTEKPIADEAKKGFKGFSFPLSFIKPRSAEAPATPIARVETPSREITHYPLPITKKNEPRTIHYSENRTPVSPFGQSNEFINLETFEKFAAPANVSPKQVNSPHVSIGSTLRPIRQVQGRPEELEGRLRSGQASSPQENQGKGTIIAITTPPKKMPVIIATPSAYADKPTLAKKSAPSPEPKKIAEPAATQATAPQTAALKPITLEGGEPKLSGNTVDLR